MELKVIGKRYSLATVAAEIIQDLGGCDGVTLAHKGKIMIADGMTEEDTRETRIHELFHAIWSAMDIGFSDSTEEKICTALAKGMSAVLSDNDPELMGEFLYGR